MKPAMLLDRIMHWQRLLDRAVGTRPTGAAKTNHLSTGDGRTSEFPGVQKVSQELIDTLQDFLKDQASFPSQNGRSPVSKQLLLPAPPSKDPGSSSVQQEAYEQYGTPDRFSSEYGSQCTSLEDLMSDTGTSPSRSAETYSEYSDQQYDKQSRLEDFNSISDASSTSSLPSLDQSRKPSMELVIFDGGEQEDQQGQGTSDSFDGLKNCWELVLFETTNKQEQTPPQLPNGRSESSVPPHQCNPFLDDIPPVVPLTSTNSNPTFTSNNNQANFADFHTVPPTFSAQNPNQDTTAPYFSSQSSAETNMAPTFCGQNLDWPSTTTTFSPRNQILAPTFSAHNPSPPTISPTFSTQSSTETNAAPTFPSHLLDYFSRTKTVSP
ncbi:clathrin coat assembly protein AP180 [Quillaja saponaria]|uniref:Clathrin coat assembly protein AP180 n=1 Tax=Quillaja saponaria TaxID=32244 RepID=A0AAD7LLG8_QUISA|nr:clathrin coat assembly protein AP180 [Quillaja saponaria]